MTTTLSSSPLTASKTNASGLTAIFRTHFAKMICSLAVLFLFVASVFAQTTTFNYSGSIVNYTVPAGVTKVTITTKGAQGGNNGGLGASMQGDFAVTPGQVLKILVGGQGGVSSGNSGGGGGSFVTTSTNTPLIIAGGGGGATCAAAGLPGVTSTNGTNGNSSSSGGYGGGGGSNGGGGGGSAGRYGAAAGGAGLIGNGGRGIAATGFFSYATGGGVGGNGTNGGDGTAVNGGSYTGVSNSFIAGGAPAAYGGFGGGGGVYVYDYCYSGAGGGGYSGGGGSYNSGGGGGGSYNNGTNQVNTAGARAGNGVVTITPIAAGAAINFDGVDDYLRTTNPFYQYTNSITVEAWINTTQSVWMGQSTPDVDNWSNSNVWLWHIKGPGQGMDWYVNDGGVARGISLNTLSAGWHHIATTANACGMFIYVDGVLTVSSSTGISTGILNVANSVLDIGKDPRYSNVVSTGTDRYTAFSADEVRIWSRSLSKQEINAHKSCELIAGQMTGLQQYYQFNQGFSGVDNTTITTVTDASGNARHASINNLARTGTTSNFISPGGVTTGSNCSAFSLAAITGNGPLGIGGNITLANATAGGTWSSSVPGVATVNASGVVTGVSAGTTVISYTIDCGTAATVTVTVSAPATALKFNPSLAPNDNSRLNYVSVDNPFRTYQKEMTVEFWMYTANANLPFGSVMGQGANNDAQNTVWLMHPNDNGTMTFYVSDGGVLRATNANIIAGGWHHYAGVASATSTRFYVDGALVHTGPGISGNILNNLTSVIHIGKDVRFATRHITNNDPWNRYATITLDELRIWNRALCAEEIMNNKNVEINPAGQTGLQQYYRFNQGLAGANNASITTLTDLSGNNRIGTLNNFTLDGANSNWVTSGSTNTGIAAAFVPPTVPITGITSICTGAGTTLANANAGGVWTSNNTAVATVNATTGAVNGVSAGTATITYTTACGGVSTATVTINPIPVVTIAAVGGTSTCPGSFVTLNANAPVGSTYLWSKGGVAISGAVNASYNATASGSYTVVVVNNGCTSVVSNAVVITVADVQPPAITCPANISVPATSLAGAVVNYVTPVGTDNCPGVTTVRTAGPASGSVFPIGTTTVTHTVTDAVGLTASCSFTVTVAGAQPVVVCPANIIVSNDPGQCGAKVNFAATETTGIPASTITYSIAPGSVFPVGTTTVTATAVNALGSSTCNFTVTVTATDTDADGVPDACDLDADNDGIPNSLECNQSNFFWSNPPALNGNTATGTINGIAYTYTSTSPVSTTTYMYGHNQFPVSYGVPNVNPTIQNLAITNNTITFASPMTNPVLVFASIGNPTLPVPITFGAPVEIVWSKDVTVNSTTSITGREGYAIVRMMGTFSSISFNYQAAENWCNFAFGADFQNCGDTDNDGIPNYLDTDSDGDGCPDAIEGSLSLSMSNVSNGRLTGGVNSQGIPLLAGAGQTVGTSQNFAANCFCQPGLDETAPTVITQNITVNLNASGTATITPAQVNNGSSDACGIASISVSKTNFTCSDIGANTVTLSVRDNDGNVGSATAVVTVVDNIPPAIICPANISVIATSAAGAVVSYAAPVGTDNCAGVTTAMTSGLASGSVFPLGTTTVTYRVTDGAGLTASCSFTVTVAGVPPVIVCPANITVNNDPGQCGAVVNFAVTETTGVPASTISYSIASGSFFPVGTTTVTATATNTVGSSSCSFTVMVKDVTPPTIVCAPNVTINTTPGLCTGTTILTAPTVTDNCSGGVAGNALNFAGNSSKVSGSTNGFPVGNAPRTIEAWSKCNSVNIFGPVFGYGTNLVSGNEFTLGVHSNGKVFFWGHNADLFGTTNIIDGQWHHLAVTYNGSTVKLYVDGVLESSASKTLNTASNSTFYMGSIPSTGFAYNGTIDEVHLWNVERTQAQIQASMVNELSAHPGLVALYHLNQGIAGGNNTGLTSVNDASGNNFNGTISGMILNGPTSNWVGGKSFGPSVTNNAPSAYPLGSTIVTWTATDAAGNSSTCNQTVTVLDNTPPTISCPSNITAIATSAAGAVVSYTAPVGTDNCAGVSTAMTSGLASGSVFPLGTTTVTYRVTDGAGLTASCSFTVTVTGVPPVIVCPANITVNKDPGQCGAVVNFAATETTGIPASTITYSIPSGSFFNVGETTVTATATNAIGSSTCTFTVRVNDTEVPTVITQNVTVYLDNNGQASITPAQVNNGSTDNCAIATMSVSPNTFTCANVSSLVNISSQTIVSDNTWVESTTTYSTGNYCISSVWNGLASPLPSLASYTVVPTINAYSIVPIAGTQGMYGQNGVRFFRKTFTLNNLTDIKATLQVAMDNGVQIFINGVAVALKGVMSNTFNGANPVKAVLNSTGANLNGGVGGQSFDNITNTSASSLFVVGTNEIVLALANCDGTDRGAISFKAVIETNNGGQRPVVLTVTDVNGNTASANALVTVVDVINPVLTCQDNIEVIATSASGATVNYAALTATDNCSAVVTRTAGLASGATFPIGTTTVTHTATDPSGNTVSCSFTVTVSGLPPVITCPTDITVTSTAGQCGANVNFAATETTAIPASVITYTENGQPVSSGSFFTVGTHAITATATNAVGSSVCTFTITVTDTETPVIIAPANIAVNNDAGVCGAQISITAPVATDNCGIASVIGVRTDGLLLTDVYPVGITAIMWNATDVNGLTSGYTQLVTVTDSEAPVVLTNNIVIALDANGTASITTAQINNNSTDNCGIATVSLDKTAFDCANVGANTVILTVTDVNGNSASQTATVTVLDNTAPIVTLPAAQVFCANANGSNQYTIPAAAATDNCSIATVTYAVTGATSRTGTGYDASGAFNIGTSTISWTVTDVNGNSSTGSITVVVNPLPVATYVSSNADAFCNQTSLTASSSITPALYSWSASNTPGTFSANPVLSLGLTHADGNYYLYTQSSVTGCVSATAAVYNFQKQSLSSSYTILAYKEVELGKYNKVLSGSVGVMTAKGEAEFKSYSGVTGAGSFVKAPKIDKDGSGITLNSQLIGIAAVTLPTMQYNTASTNNLPSVTASQNNATLTGNYKNLTIKKGISVTVSGNTFGNIRLEEGASIRFTSTVLNIENLTADRGSRNNDYTYVRFAPNTSVRVGNKVSIGSQVLVNPESYKVSIYMGDKRKDEEKFTVKGGDTRVIANVLMPNGKLRVTATDSDDDDKHGDCDHKSHSSKDCKHRGHEHNDCDHRVHTASNCQDDVYMTGLFIAEQVESKGNKVIWNSYDCSAPAAPITSVNNSKGVTQSVSAEQVIVKSEEELKVTVMPNPSTTYFTLKLESKYETPVNLRVIDGAGRVVDARSKLGSNSTFQIGHSYSSGTYYAELIQGTRRKVVQLIKARG